MSAAIQTALINLNAKIEKMEAAIERAKKPAKAGEHDLFSVVAGGKKPVNANVDAKVLATRLDSAISKVEQILKEGQA